MYIIGITGGIGSGKSLVCEYLQKDFDAEIIMADNVAHDVMKPGTDCHKKLRELFADEYFLSDGSLNRKKAGSLAFKNPDILDAMNNIIHPAVWDEIQVRLKEAENTGKKLAVIEAALLIGSRYRDICSEFWYIYSDVDKRLERLISSRDITVEKAKDVMRNQLSDDEFKSACDFTVNNSGDFEKTKEQIKKHLSERYDL